MVTKVIKIGNSRGIRIPRTVFEQIGITDEVEMEVKEKELIIRPIGNPRKDWGKIFERMAKYGDDELLDDESLKSQNSWDEKEWEW